MFGLFFEDTTLFGYTAAGEQITIDLTTGAGTFDKNVTGNLTIGGAGSLPSTGPIEPPIDPDPEVIPEPTSMFGLMALGYFGFGSYMQCNQI